MIRILITGSRDWPCHELADQVVTRLIARYGPTFTLVHGGATGVDAAFDEAARDHGIEVECHPADWTAHGRAAGPRRNQAMVSLGATLCIAVSKDLRVSRGTANCARLAIEAGIPVWLIDSDEGVPRRIG